MPWFVSRRFVAAAVVVVWCAAAKGAVVHTRSAIETSSRQSSPLGFDRFGSDYAGGGGAAHCVGDCDNDGSVVVGEIIRAVNIALGNAAIGDCEAFDVDASSTITVDELLKGVNAALFVCPVPPQTSTATATITPPATTTATPTQTPTIRDATATPVTPTHSVGFELRLGSPSIIALQGSNGLLRVHVEREPGFAAEVEVGLVDPPAGITAEAVVVVEDGGEAQLPIRIASSVAEGPLSLTISGVGGGVGATVGLEVNVAAAQPNSLELIQAALDAGQIDYGTSLLYRAYAVFGDPRLPPSFVGAGPAEEDAMLFTDIERDQAMLPAEVLEQLRPFLLRPDDPQSFFNAGHPTGPAGLAAQAANDGCPGDTREWITARSAQHPVRAWTLCEGTPDTDRIAGANLLKVLAVVDKAYGKMVQLMGPAIPDEYGDDAIDVYVVPPGATVPRELGDYDVQAVRGVAPAQPPYAGRSSSGYVMLPTWRMAEVDHQITVIHELFHVLQHAHNYTIDWWFREASATWASVHFNRTAPIRPAANRDLHLSRFAFGYQVSSAGLLALGGDHPYESYIWPLFMEQKGTAALVGGVYRQISGASTRDQALNVLNFLFPFDENFHTFAVRNLNAAFLPGDPIPESERYVGLDPVFTDRFRPRKKTAALRRGEAYTTSVNMPPLSAAYFEVSVLPGTIRKVELDLTGLPPANLDVDALIQAYDDDEPLESAWVPRPVSFTGQGLVVFCFDEGPATETRRGAFLQLQLVLSNHGLRTPLEGELRLIPSPTPCHVWAGTTTQTVDHDDGFQQTTGTITTNVVFEFDEAAVEESAPGATPFRLQSGDFVYEWNVTSRAGTSSCHSVATAGGAMHRATSVVDFSAGATFANLTVYSGNPPKYGGGGGSYAEVTTVTTCSDGFEGTSTNIGPINWWPGVNGLPVQTDGQTIRGSNEVFGGIHTEWTFTKMRQ